MAARVAAGVLAAVVTGAAIGGVMLYDTEAGIVHITFPVPELLPGVIAFSVAGAVLILVRTARTVGWLLMGGAMLYAASIMSAGLWKLSLQKLSLQQMWTSGNPTLLIAQSATVLVANWLSFFLLPQLFPDGGLKGWLWRTLLAVSVLLLLTQIALIALGFWQYLFLYEGDPRMIPVDAEWALRVVPRLGHVSAVIAVVALLERVRRGPRQRRRQVAGFAAVYLTSQAVYYLSWVTVDPDLEATEPVLGIIYPPAVVVAIAFAMLRYGLFDVQPVMHRAAVYALLVVGLTAGFAAVYLVVLSGLSAQLAGGPYSWLIPVAALVVVLAADPVRRRLRLRLERRFLGERGEPLRVLARLDQMVATARSDDRAVLTTVAETVLQAVRCPGAVVLLHRAGTLEPVASAGTVGDEPLVLPLVHRGERLGELRVATRTPGETYGRADRELLDQIAGQTAAISYGLRRDHDIDRLRTIAVEVMAEQRAQLGRDLHDGLAPLLAGAGLTAEALRRGMPEASPDAEEASRLATRLRTAATEVRRIAHDLQPSGTGTAGLTRLIRDHVGSLTGPDLPAFSVDLDDLDDRTLPATVELVVSRVALEAIANVVRHAHASRAQVSLRIVNGRVVLVVSDDGVGIGKPYVSGLGITSMRARIEAIGGTFDLTPDTDGGTRLTAQIPVAT